MATVVTFNGSSFSIPAYGDIGWAQGTGNLSAYLIAIASGTLQTTGGTFTLSAPLNFGATYGLISPYVTTNREVYVVGTPLDNYTGSTTVVHLVHAYPVGGGTLSAYVNGILNDVIYDYAETSTLIVTFNTPLNIGDRVTFRWR